MSNSTFLPASADSLARLHTAEAMGTVVSIMRGQIPNPKEAAVRLRAAEIALDRGHGRAVQAVISVPARQAVAAKLAALSDDALLQIAQAGGGVPERKGGPTALASRGGTIQAPDADPQELMVMSNRRGHISSRELAEAVDGEFEETYDPCA